MDASTCSVLCQHPSCWATRRMQERGLARSLPPIGLDDDSSDDEINLPKQSICNLLEDYGESPTDRYPLSTGGRPSHTVEGAPPVAMPVFSPQSFDSRLQLGAPHNTTASFMSKQTGTTKRSVKRNPRLRLVEVQEVFDRDDLRAQWDETFVTKQYYVWMPNPSKRRRQLPHGYKHYTGRSTARTKPILVKDLTECMVPSEIEQKREETVLFDEWPVLKKRQPRIKSPTKTPRTSHGHQEAILDGPVDREGINELLALPKDTLMKVLEHTKKSDFTSPGRLHAIVQHLAQDDERAQLALGARHSFQHKKLQAADKRTGRHQVALPGGEHSHDTSATKPVYQLDTNADEDHGIIDRLSSVNTPIKKSRRPPVAEDRGMLDEEEQPDSDADSVETFPRYAHPLPGIKEPLAPPKPLVPTQRVLHYRGKIPSISLGLPELPSGIKTTKAFNYKRKDMDFSLGPVITPPSSYRSSEGPAYSEHGTTLKVNVSSTMPGMPESQYRDEDLQAIHRVSPALSTNVPVPPAGTPATFAHHASPTKSAPAGHLQHQYSWDTTRVTINWSQSALPPSQGEGRGDSAQVVRLLVTPPTHTGEGGEGLEREATEERALDTINETAREGAAAAEAAIETAAAAETDETRAPGQTGQQQGQEGPADAALKPPTLHLETSALKRIGAAESPQVPRSARSVESCPSPEQWPLISESSFENVHRPSVSEPALSARSDRRRPMSRDSRRDFAARKAMDDNKMKTESPAPPPPSPEPKDHTGESRARKDLRSRDSLTMAPLFEVAEMDDGSPVREGQQGRHPGQVGASGRAVGHLHSKKIEVTVPAESDNAVKEEDSGGDKAGEMISQMTVMHVIPKGRPAGKRERAAGEVDRVQETFLNVDIPAEDVSSLKAEHGSSHQEDISSNDTVVRSHTTGSEGSASPRARLRETTEQPGNQQGEAGGEEGEETGETGENRDGADGAVGDAGAEVRATSPVGGDTTARVEVPNSHRDMLDVSNESPELLCDSARFMSHEQVSPVEGESGANTHRFVLEGLENLVQEEGEEGDDPQKTLTRQENLLGNLTRRLDEGSVLKNDEEEREGGEDKEEGDAVDDGEIEGEATKPTDDKGEKSAGGDEKPPGVFFFQGSSPSESSEEAQTEEQREANVFNAFKDDKVETGDEASQQAVETATNGRSSVDTSNKTALADGESEREPEVKQAEVNTEDSATFEAVAGVTDPQGGSTSDQGGVEENPSQEDVEASKENPEPESTDLKADPPSDDRTSDTSQAQAQSNEAGQAAAPADEVVTEDVAHGVASEQSAGPGGSVDNGEMQDTGEEIRQDLQKETGRAPEEDSRTEPEVGEDKREEAESAVPDSQVTNTEDAQARPEGVDAGDTTVEVSRDDPEGTAV